MKLVDSARQCRASAVELRAGIRRFGEAALEIEQAVALIRDAAELMSEGEPVRALARVREAAAMMGCGTLH
ncbi:hypothetical protein I6F21_02535 [Bradyrhizobium sp. NBAIM03]|uniref:hypothetical protein n=1 Tax=Bradyrhizobium sp. NBAIM03 TaxID=2793816 RepID=UPI001CD2FEA5|nr:hypothetical protein [Bradyrhizobium sp. NBAIM03]MCA1531434.1 hypothetical protein [Bradyrhizobium sp. NBAIM03]